MMKLRFKLSLFNLLSKIAFTALFFLFLPYITERISLRQVDEELIQKREQVIRQISEVGIEPFIVSDSLNAFGNYNILKEEYISIEKADTGEEINDIQVSSRMIEGEEIQYRTIRYTFSVDGNPYLLELGKSLSSIYRLEKYLKRIMFIFLLLIILSTFLTDLQYTRHILKPLDKITKKLDKIPDPSQFDKKPVKSTTKDFVKLDRSLTELMGHINSLFQREKDITVNISHELLTPVSVLRSKLENLSRREDMGSEVKSKIEESLKMLHRLQNLINSLLMIARIESLQYLKNESVSVQGVIAEIVEETSPVAENSSIVLMNSISDDYIIENANKALIFSMFSNIINNAVKNTPEKGTIEIKNNISAGRYILEISDSGKGISPEQIDSLFTRFSTGSGKGSAGGTGIGLAISKSIADFHDIKIKVDSFSRHWLKIFLHYRPAFMKLSYSGFYI
jgi:signal transduction histidine kinase